MLRVQIEQPVLARHFRASAFAMVNCWLNQQRVMMVALNMDLTELTIFLTVSVAGVQRLVRLPEIPEEFWGHEALPVPLVGTISRRAIAEATGLPRETVRRTVNDLIRRGHLLAAGPRAVCTARGSVRHEGTEHVPALLAAEVQRLLDDFARLGALASR